MKLVYIAGPLTHPSPEVMALRRARAMGFGRTVEAMGPFVAFVPHAHILEPLAPTPAEVWKVAMRKCIAHLRRCDLLVPLPDWRESRGARMEVWLCRRLAGFPRVVQIEDLEAIDVAG